MFSFDRPLPVVAAPMAGASTPELAAAVTNAGGLGFLAAGYLSVEAMAAEVTAYRALAEGPVAINLFTPQRDRSIELADPLAAHRAALQPLAGRLGVEVGAPRHDDDAFDAKVAWLRSHPVDVVTFTFGPVPAATVAALHQVGTAVGFTVTNAPEARQAAKLGADFLVAQGCGAGGHRGTWDVADEPNRLDTAEVVADVAAAVGLPIIAAGGVAHAEDVRALREIGAAAVAVGTLFLTSPESKASAAHKAALTSGEFPEARVTRAFSGRCARALVNDFVRAHDGSAPAVYPAVHHMTKPLRAAAAAAGDADGIALWAGAGHAYARPRPARDVAVLLGAEGAADFQA